MAKKSAPSPGRRPARAGANSKTSEKMQIGLRRRLLSRRMLVVSSVVIACLAVVLVLLTIFYKVYASPQRVFWDMIGNNLSTRGFTRRYVAENSARSNDEVIQVSFVPSFKVHDIKKITNKGDKSEVTLEAVGTPAADYMRYTKLNEQLKSGQTKSHSKVYDMWLLNGGNAQSGPQLVDNTAFRAVLFGNLNPSQKDKVFADLKKAYVVNFSDVSRQNIRARRTYTYDVVVPIKKYVQASRTYAELEGLPAANVLNPAAYDPRAQWRVRMTVDVLSRQLRKIEYIDQGVTEYYSGYGIEASINAPKKTTSVEEFNKALNSPVQ